MTAYGWKPIKDVKIGSRVCNPDGTISKVIAAYDHQSVPLYEISLSDGTKIVACQDHQWVSWKTVKSDIVQCSYPEDGIVEENPLSLHPAKALVVNTLNLKDWIEKGYGPAIPVTKPVLLTTPFKEQKPFKDYVIGALCLKKGLHAGRISMFISTMPREFKITSTHVLRTYDKMKWRDCEVQDRVIPPIYLKSSYQSRLTFAQGVFDYYGRFGRDGSLFISIQEGTMRDG